MASCYHCQLTWLWLQLNMTIKQITVDDSTGQVIDYQLVLVRRRTKSIFSSYAAMSIDAFKALSEIRSGVQLRVLMRLLAELDFENWIRIKQADIASEMGLDAANMSKAIAGLVKREVLLRGPDRTLRLNPLYGWRGSNKAHKQAINARAEEAGLTVLDGGKS